MGRLSGLMLLGFLMMVGGSPVRAQNSLPTDTTPLVGFSAGKFDVMDSVHQDSAGDFRFEYRFGTPLFYVIKPFVGVEATTDGSAGVLAGLVADWVLADHWIINPSFAAVGWAHGAGKDMGSALEFRSQLEAGYRFDNAWRLTGAFSHMSNADISNDNPGAETVSLYLHVPTSTLFPR